MGLCPLSLFLPLFSASLQHLWDSGNRLVSLLDDSAWKMLAELDGSDALAVVEDTSTAMAQEAIEDVNGLIVVRIRSQVFKALVSCLMSSIANVDL